MLASRVETWLVEWKQQGLEEGRAEGQRERARRKTHGRTPSRPCRAAGQTKQLRIKFGKLPDNIANRLEQASEQELEFWSERILFKNSLEAIFTENQNELDS